MDISPHWSSMGVLSCSRGWKCEIPPTIWEHYEKKNTGFWAWCTLFFRQPHLPGWITILRPPENSCYHSAKHLGMIPQIRLTSFEDRKGRVRWWSKSSGVLMHFSISIMDSLVIPSRGGKFRLKTRQFVTSSAHFALLSIGRGSGSSWRWICYGYRGPQDPRGAQGVPGGPRIPPRHLPHVPGHQCCPVRRLRAPSYGKVGCTLRYYVT